MWNARNLQPACGIRVAASRAVDAARAVKELEEQLKGEELQHVIAFFSYRYDAHVLGAQLGEAFGGVSISGCSTAGEITPDGMVEDGILLFAFPKRGFRVVTELLENVRQSGVEEASSAVRRLKSRLGYQNLSEISQNVFCILLIDGLSNYEEVIVAAINWAMGDLQLVGGSAGDGLAFDQTFVLSDGQAVSNAALLIMVETDVPFQAFRTQDFVPTPTKLVVTSADTEARVVHELNAEPAALEYANAIGLLPDDLGPFSFASYPLVVKVGGDYYCRSIRNMNDDGSLSFFCAIDEGLVFTVAQPKDMVDSTASTLRQIDKSLGGIDVVLGFDCVLRRLDSETRQIRHSMDELYTTHNVVGFHTYGEQFNAMHLNQTLTGIAFGKGEKPDERQTLGAAVS